MTLRNILKHPVRTVRAWLWRRKYLTIPMDDTLPMQIELNGFHGQMMARMQRDMTQSDRWDRFTFSLKVPEKHDDGWPDVIGE